MSDLPYRPNVGAVLFNRQGLVFVARRADMPNAEGPAGGWQLPQGGIDEGEDPRIAIFRELEEEIGTRKADIIAEHPEWLTYDLPPDLLGIAWRGRFRGQRQRWFAMRFTGEDSDIRLDLDPHPEFDAWRWVTLAELPALAVCPSNARSMTPWRYHSPPSRQLDSRQAAFRNVGGSPAFGTCPCSASAGSPACNTFRDSISSGISIPVVNPMLSSMNTRSSVTTLPDAPGA